MMRYLLGFIAGFFVVTSAAPVSAQVVRGRILDEGSGGAIGGGFVRLVAADGRVAASTLSNSTGGYQLTAAAGMYVLRVERLGFRTHETESFRLEGTIVRDISVPQEAIQIPSIEARAERRCASGSEMASAAAVLWEEVRKALAITSWTSSEGNVVFEIRSVRQQLSPGMLLLDERAAMSTSAANGSPFAALSADSLMRHGFIKLDENDTLHFYGPDAELVLSDAFQQTHCFRAVTDRKKPGLIGLAFEPNSSIGTPDIKGTLWIDRSSYQLRSLDFQYSRLPRNAPSYTAGGEIRFARLDTGMWILSEWTLTAPVMARGARVIFDRPDAHTPYDRGTARLLGAERAIRSVVRATVNDQVIYSAPRLD